MLWGFSPQFTVKKNMDMRERNLQNSPFWPGVGNNYDSASSIYNPAILVIINWQVSTSSSRLKIKWLFQDQYLLRQRFGNRFKWIISFNISLEEPMSANRLWSWPVDSDFPGENVKDLRMIRCRLTRIFNPEHNLSNLFLCLYCRLV